MITKNMIKQCLLTGLLGSLLIVFAGCVKTSSSKAITAHVPDFFGVGQELSLQLVENRRRSFGKGERLIFTTIVNIDDLGHTSRFGRTLSESMATSLFQLGYGVVELRKQANVLVKDKEGELVLSRISSRLAKQHAAEAIVAGTYSMTPTSVIINIKLLDAMSKEVLSVAGLELNRSHSINSMLGELQQFGMVDSELSGYEN